ncbi:STAS domain-containing protein [Parasulfitobacter algicola]|uniref:Anti-sigma factor antagonist n=1 Tax=Parasulfitobacter algicola TaxID=2614809 RepID=A0ABX2IKH6_9RHOB|nr:STAS domain-containing protein [Sulfitobacter algicola]NSX53384.1 STAS domain-containing protein [Sulfitobacter algicola]
MHLTSTVKDNAIVVTVVDTRIDAAVAIKFKDSMRDETKEGPDRVILDMSNVDFVDSSGLGAIVAVMKLLKTGQLLELSGLTPTVDKVFRLTRMNSVFAIHLSVEEALASKAA